MYLRASILAEGVAWTLRSEVPFRESTGLCGTAFFCFPFWGEGLLFVFQIVVQFSSNLTWYLVLIARHNITMYGR